MILYHIVSCFIHFWDIFICSALQLLFDVFILCPFFAFFLVICRLIRFILIHFWILTLGVEALWSVNSCCLKILITILQIITFILYLGLKRIKISLIWGSSSVRCRLACSLSSMLVQSLFWFASIRIGRWLLALARLPRRAVSCSTVDTRRLY